MRDDRPEHASTRDGGAGDWCIDAAGEPRLEELMEDPMMGLIWRRDGLEPPRARQTVLELQAIVRAARQTSALGQATAAHSAESTKLRTIG
jgi:hypothetical protein